MAVLALDVDGVLLDPDRGGEGPWTVELEARFGIDPVLLRERFFRPCWPDIVTGRRPVEATLAAALVELGSPAEVEAVLSCWFDADYTPIEESFALARRAAGAGHRLVLATNQEHRRAAYLRRGIGDDLPLDDVVYSADIGYEKHDRRFFELASERLGLGDAARRETVLFVDDVAENVETARSAGWRAVHAPPGRDWQPEVEQLLGLTP